jgi:hypothetical protein
VARRHATGYGRGATRRICVRDPTPRLRPRRAFALRIGNVVRTVSSTSALRWAQEPAISRTDCSSRTAFERPMSSWPLLRVGWGERWLPAHRWVPERPSAHAQAHKVVFNVLTTKTINSGDKPVKHMATLAHGGGGRTLGPDGERVGCSRRLLGPGRPVLINVVFGPHCHAPALARRTSSTLWLGR